MAATMARPSKSGRLVTGPRTGIIIMVGGLVAAGIAALLVFVVARQSRATAPASQPLVAQVYVVMATRDVADGGLISADAVAVKPFPEAFAPQGALTTLDQAIGKYATTRLTRDQILLGGQVTATRLATNLTESIPAGKVALWMSMPELLAQAGSLRAGDRVDILLSLALPAAPGAGQGAAGGGNLTTQTTLQNVEVLFVGAPPDPAAPAPSTAQGARTTTGTKTAAAPAKPSAAEAAMVLFVVDPQDAVVAKFVKDSGGAIDFVIRSREAQDVASTSAVDARSLADRFNFRPR